MMYKFLFGLAILGLLNFSPSYAQNGKKALVEVFTNSHCSVCPSMYNGLNTYVKSTPLNNDVIYIFHHINTYNDDALYQETKAQSLPRANFYAVNATPTAAINGMVQDRVYSEYPSRISQAIQQSQDINISLEGMIQNNGLSLTINTDKEIPNNTSLYIVVTEDIQYKGRNGISEHNNVMRKMLTGVNGSAPEANTGMIFSGDFSFEELNTRNLNNAAIVCFLQNNSTKEISQATRKSISSFVLASATDNEESSGYVYPNPAQGNCTITVPYSNISTLVIYSVTGEKIIELSSLAQREGNASLFIWQGYNSEGNSVPKGIYFAKTDDNSEQSFNLPIIIQ